jgi:2'-hydroxyisoflavone reductase
MHRRAFLGTAALALSGCLRSTPPAVSSKRILILGGTNFVGPNLLRAARQAGHEVTIFNRGLTAPSPPTDVEWLQGDRLLDGGLGALNGDRQWDAVVDTWAGHPRAVEATASLLADRTNAYVYTSSIAVYMRFRDHGISEDTAPDVPLQDLPADPSYPVAKRAAEQMIERRFGDRACVLRCTSILGINPHGGAGYWPLRIRRGGAVLAPDDDDAVIQLIDVRDVADFAFALIDRNVGGAFNVVGPAGALPFRTYLTEMRAAWLSRPESADFVHPYFEWVDPRHLIEHGVTPFDVLPNWIPADDTEPGFYRISNDRALNAGLTFRPLLSTFADIFVSIEGRSADPEDPNPLSSEREEAVLRAWRRRSQNVPSRTS